LLTLLARIGKVIGPERAKASNNGKTKSGILLSHRKTAWRGVVALGSRKLVIVFQKDTIDSRFVHDQSIVIVGIAAVAKAPISRALAFYDTTVSRARTILLFARGLSKEFLEGSVLACIYACIPLSTLLSSCMAASLFLSSVTAINADLYQPADSANIQYTTRPSCRPVM
jgi:hypothetical protein